MFKILQISHYIHASNASNEKDFFLNVDFLSLPDSLPEKVMAMNIMQSKLFSIWPEFSRISSLNKDWELSLDSNGGGFCLVLLLPDVVLKVVVGWVQWYSNAYLSPWDSWVLNDFLHLCLQGFGSFSDSDFDFPLIGELVLELLMINQLFSNFILLHSAPSWILS